MNATRTQRGFTIVEIMVAVTISLILLAGVVQVFVGSKQAYRTNEALGRTQESGRFALDILSREARPAGYSADCPVAPNDLLNPDGDNYDPDLFDLGGAIMGWDDTAGPHSGDMNVYQRGDVLLIKHTADSGGVTASGNTGEGANAIGLTGPSGIAQGTILFVVDEEGCDIFQNRNNENAASLTRGASHNNPGPGNLIPGPNDWSHAYGSDMQIRLFRSDVYYIGRSDADPARPALRRIRYGGGTTSVVEHELVDGVEDMQITYGVDSDGDKTVDPPYVAAAAVTDWGEVLAVRISLLVQSPEPNLTAEGEDQDLTYNGAAVDTSDRRLRQVFTTTVALRNRLP